MYSSLFLFKHGGEGMFTAILYGVAGTGLIASLSADRQKTKKALMKAWKSFENILPQFLSVLVIIGLTLIPGFVAFPLAAALLKNGAGYAQIAAFVSSLVMVGVATLPMEFKVFGKRAAILRNVLVLGVIFQ